MNASRRSLAGVSISCHDAHELRGISTILLAPAAKVLIQVELGAAVAKLDVGQPFGDDVEKASIQPNCDANDGKDNPPLSSIVGFAYPLPPVELARAVETGLAFPPSLPAQLLPRGILDPVFLALADRFDELRGAMMTKRVHTDGCEVLEQTAVSQVVELNMQAGQRGHANLVAFDFCDLFLDLVLRHDPSPVPIVMLAALGDGHGGRQTGADRGPAHRLRGCREGRRPRLEVHGAGGRRSRVSSMRAALGFRTRAGCGRSAVSRGLRSDVAVDRIGTSGLQKRG
jgi:hypothetical protein